MIAKFLTEKIVFTPIPKSHEKFKELASHLDRIRSSVIYNFITQSPNKSFDYFVPGLLKLVCTDDFFLYFGVEAGIEPYEDTPLLSLYAYGEYKTELGWIAFEERPVRKHLEYTRENLKMLQYGFQKLTKMVSSCRSPKELYHRFCGKGDICSFIRKVNNGFEE